MARRSRRDPEFRITRDGNEIGAFPEREIKRRLKTGALKESDYYWTEGMNDWETVASRFPKDSKKTGIIITVAAGAVLIAVFFVGGFFFFFKGDPKATKLPPNLEEWAESKDLKAAVEGLSEEDRELFTGYMARAALAESFTKEGLSDQAKSVGEAIDLQKEWIASREEKANREKELAEELHAEKEAASREMDEVLTVSLIDISHEKEEFGTGYRVSVAVGFHNRSSKDLSGAKGVVLFRDVFDDEIHGVTLSNDTSIGAGEKMTWNGGIDVSRFNDEGMKLINTPQEKLKFEWIPLKYVFADGTVMKTPE